MVCFITNEVLCNIYNQNNKDKCYGLNCVPSNSYVEALTPNMMVFGEEAF